MEAGRGGPATGSRRFLFSGRVDGFKKDRVAPSGWHQRGRGNGRGCTHRPFILTEGPSRVQRKRGGKELRR